MPRVSVIIPTYNRAALLREAIQSVLDQTYQDIEIIVVDDGSTDDTVSVVEQFEHRLRYIYQSNAGVSAARNSGLQVAEGEFVAFLDSDDTFLQGKLAQQVPVLESDARLGVVASGIAHVDETGRVRYVEEGWLASPEVSLRSTLLAGLCSLHGALIRRDWLAAVGGFDPTLASAEDMDLWYQLGLAGCRMVWRPYIVGRRLIHAGNSSRRFVFHSRQAFQVLNKVWRDSRLPVELQLLQGRVEGLVYVGLAGRCFAVGDSETGRWAVEQAISADPSLLSDHADQLARLMLGWLDNPWLEEKRGFMAGVVDHLPPAVKVAGVTCERLEQLQAKRSFYAAYLSGDYPAVPSAWRAVARSEPGWWINRGSWSILVRSLRRSLSHKNPREV